MEKQEILEEIKLATEEVALILWDGPRLSNQKAVLENIDKALMKGWDTIPCLLSNFDVIFPLIC